METARSLNGRLGKLEEHAEAQHVRAMAGHLGAEVGCDPDVLLERAEEIARLIDRHGRERTIELVATGLGLSAEQLEERAARFVASVA